MKASMTVPRGKGLLRAVLLLSGFGIALSGCIYAPPPYAYGGGYGEGYGPNYAYAPAPNYYPPGYAYGPGFYFGPSIVFGGGWDHDGGRGRGRR